MREVPGLAVDLADARALAAGNCGDGQLPGQVDPMPTLSFPDVEEALKRAGKGAVLESHELRDQASVLALWEEVQRYGADGTRGMLRLGQRRRCARVGSWIIEAQASTGRLDRLGWLYPRNRQRRSYVGSLITRTTSNSRFAISLSTFCVRVDTRRSFRAVFCTAGGPLCRPDQDRHAAPRRRYRSRRLVQRRHRVFEPRELVDLNNAIKVADQVDRALRILRDLSSRIAEQADVILMGMEALAHLDAIAARAALGRQLRAHPVALNGDGRTAEAGQASVARAFQATSRGQ